MFIASCHSPARRRYTCCLLALKATHLMSGEQPHLFWLPPRPVVGALLLFALILVFPVLMSPQPLLTMAAVRLDSSRATAPDAGLGNLDVYRTTISTSPFPLSPPSPTQTQQRPPADQLEPVLISVDAQQTDVSSGENDINVLFPPQKAGCLNQSSCVGVLLLRTMGCIPWRPGLRDVNRIACTHRSPRPPAG